MKKTVIISLLVVLCVVPMRAQQIYNMDFDDWSKESGTWYARMKDAPASKRVWDSANPGLSTLGVNGTTPEYKHVAVPGEGKAAAKIESKKVLWAFVAGNLFTGKFNKVVELSGADLDFGIPFSGRPKSLSGYVHYIPKPVNYAKEPYLHMKGKTDYGRIEVLLMDMDKPYHIVTCKEEFFDTANDPRVIGRAVMELTKDTGGYIHFDIPFKYNSAKTPKYAIIVVTPSWYGSWFTGGSGSTVYVDEFKFNY